VNSVPVSIPVFASQRPHAVITSSITDTFVGEDLDDGKTASGVHS
jgi:hypothetical protein